MGRKNKQLLKRNQVQIYVPTTFFPKWERFQDYIEKDANLKALQPPAYKGTLTSFALRLLVNRYVKEKDAEAGFVDTVKKKKVADSNPDTTDDEFDMSQLKTEGVLPEEKGIIETDPDAQEEEEAREVPELGEDFSLPIS